MKSHIERFSDFSKEEIREVPDDAFLTLLRELIALQKMSNNEFNSLNRMLFLFLEESLKRINKMVDLLSEPRKPKKKRYDIVENLNKEIVAIEVTEEE